jgi:hypothetical protein
MVVAQFEISSRFFVRTSFSGFKTEPTTIGNGEADRSDHLKWIGIGLSRI